MGKKKKIKENTITHLIVIKDEFNPDDDDRPYVMLISAPASYSVSEITEIVELGVEGACENEYYGYSSISFVKSFMNKYDPDLEVLKAGVCSGCVEMYPPEIFDDLHGGKE